MTFEERLNLAALLAAEVDSTRHAARLPDPLLSWYEGDVIARLLRVVGQLIPGEPLAELADELAAELRTRIGPQPGHDPARMVDAVLDALGRQLGIPAPGEASTDHDR